MTVLPQAGLDARLAGLAGTRPADVPAADAGQLITRAGSATFYTLAGADRPVAALRLFWDGGAAAEDDRLAGLHGLALQALLRSAAPGADSPLAERLESMGVSAAAGATERSAYLELRGPREYLHPAARLTAAAVAAGALGQQAFAAARSAALHEADRRAHDLVRLAADQFRAARAASGGFLARSPAGTADSLRLISAADCEALLARLARAGLRVIVAGDGAVDGYASDVAELIAEPGQAPAGPAGPLLRADPPAKVIAASGHPDHAYLLWGTASQSAAPADHVALELASHLLGGWTGSRWNRLFREELGLTYGVRQLVRSLAAGPATCCLSYVGMAVAATALAAASDLLASQAAAFAAEPPPADELRAAAVLLLRTEAHFHDSISKLMARAATFLQAGLPPEFAAERIAALRSIEPDWLGARLGALLSQPTMIVLSDRTG